jgi:hypothetical protein
MRVSKNQEQLIKDATLNKLDFLSDQLPAIYQVKGRHFGSHTYIIESPNALQILLQPWVVGLKLAQLARLSSTEFLKVAYHLCPEFKDSSFTKLAEVIPLAGALYYHIAEAFEQVFNESLKQCFIGARRIINDSQNEWITELSYLNFEALPEDPVVLLGDTIATGGTIKKIIKTTIDHAKNPRAIVLYSIAGSSIGAYKLHALENELHVPIYAFFSNALFGVAPNGTDMPWLHPATITTPQIREEVLKVYGERLGREWCAIWDWGERAKDPYKHLQHLLTKIQADLEQLEYNDLHKKLSLFKEEVQQAIEKRQAALQI